MDAVGRLTEVVAPDPLEQHRPRHHLPRVTQKHLEDREFRAGQPHRALASPHLTRPGIHAEVGETQPALTAVDHIRAATRVRAGIGRCREQRAAQQRPEPFLQLLDALGELLLQAEHARADRDPRAQLLGIERLDQVVVGTRVQTGHPVADVVARGQHEHRQEQRVSPQLPAGLQPVQPRHAHIENHGVGFVGADSIERLPSVARRIDLIPLEAQRTSQRVAHRGIVVHDQDPHALLRCPALSNHSMAHHL